MHRICDVSCVVGVHGFQIPRSPGRSSGGELLSRSQRTVNNPVSNSSWPLNRSTEDSFIQGWPRPKVNIFINSIQTKTCVQLCLLFYSQIQAPSRRYL